MDTLEARLKAASAKYEFYRYDAKHAFANEESDTRNMPPLGYNPEAAKLAWDRTMAFFEQNLR